MMRSSIKMISTGILMGIQRKCIISGMKVFLTAVLFLLSSIDGYSQSNQELSILTRDYNAGRVTWCGMEYLASDHTLYQNPSLYTYSGAKTLLENIVNHTANKTVGRIAVITPTPTSKTTIGFKALFEPKGWIVDVYTNTSELNTLSSISAYDLVVVGCLTHPSPQNDDAAFNTYIQAFVSNGGGLLLTDHIALTADNMPNFKKMLKRISPLNNFRYDSDGWGSYRLIFQAPNHPILNNVPAIEMQSSWQRSMDSIVVAPNATVIATYGKFFRKASIASVSPTQGGPGAKIAIAGKNLSWGTIKIGGVTAAEWTYGDTIRTATVPLGGNGSNEITFTSPDGVSSFEGFTYLEPASSNAPVAIATRDYNSGRVTWCGMNYLGNDAMPSGMLYADDNTKKVLINILAHTAKKATGKIAVITTVRQPASCDNFKHLAVQNGWTVDFYGGTDQINTLNALNSYDLVIVNSINYEQGGYWNSEVSTNDPSFNTNIQSYVSDGKGLVVMGNIPKNAVSNFGSMLNTIGPFSSCSGVGAMFSYDQIIDAPAHPILTNVSNISALNTQGYYPLSYTLASNAVIISTFTKAHIAVPAITSFSPMQAPSGSTITINGSNFNRVRKVSIDGFSVPFVILSSTKIQASVGIRAEMNSEERGHIEVRNDNNTYAYLNGFTHLGNANLNEKVAIATRNYSSGKVTWCGMGFLSTEWNGYSTLHSDSAGLGKKLLNNLVTYTSGKSSGKIAVINNLNSNWGLKQMAASTGWTVDVYTSSNLLNQLSSLNAYDIVVIACHGNELTNNDPTFNSSIRSYVQGGKGLLLTGDVATSAQQQENFRDMLMAISPFSNFYQSEDFIFAYNQVYNGWNSIFKDVWVVSFRDTYGYYPKCPVLGPNSYIVSAFSDFDRLPRLTSFTPTQGESGDWINITGRNFTDVREVSIADVPLESFTVNSSTSISGIIGNSGSGDVSVTTNYGKVSLNEFTCELSPPAISASGPLAIASGGSVVVTAPEGFSYLWSNGDTSRSITVTNPGDYSVKIMLQGCHATSYFTVRSDGDYCNPATLAGAPIITSRDTVLRDLCTPIQLNASIPDIDYIAGERSSGRKATQMKGAYGFCFDSAGNLFVADWGNNRVQRFAPGSNKGVTVAGGNGKGSAPNQLNWPSDVHVDKDGNLYVLDTYNYRVQKWAPGASGGTTVAGGNGEGSQANQIGFSTNLFITKEGVIFIADMDNNRIQKWLPSAMTGITVAGGNGTGSAANQLYIPEDITGDAEGNLYVSDLGNYRVQKFSPGSTTGVTVAGGNGRGFGDNQFRYPGALFVDSEKRLYVTDNDNRRIQRWDPGATIGVTVATNTSWPVCIYIDNDRNLFVSDQADNVRKYTFPYNKKSVNISEHGNPIVLVESVAGWANPAATYYISYNPYGLARDSNGNIFVAEESRDRVYKWAPGAASGEIIAGGNGAGSGANQLNQPASLCIDQSGSVYILDRNNSRIQKWDAQTNTVSTVAGGNGVGLNADQFSFPQDMALDQNGNLYIVDFYNLNSASYYRVQKWAPNATFGETVVPGVLVTFSASTTRFPIAVDRTGSIYVFERQKLKKFSPGSNTPIATFHLVENSIILDLGIDSKDNLYYSTYDGLFKLVYGTSKGRRIYAGMAGFGADETRYYAIHIDEKDDVYFSDALNGDVKKLTFNSTSKLTWYYNGNPVGTGRFLKVTQPGNYTARMLKDCGETPVSNTITIHPPVASSVVVNASGPLTFCHGGSVALSAPSGYSKYLWNNGDSTQVINPTATGDYTVQVTNAAGCSMLSDTLKVKALLAGVNGPYLVCEKDTVELWASPDFNSYQWKRDGVEIPGGTGMQLKTFEGGNYTVTGTTPGGSCTSSILQLTKVKAPVLDSLTGNVVKISSVQYKSCGPAQVNIRANFFVDSHPEEAFRYEVTYDAGGTREGRGDTLSLAESAQVKLYLRSAGCSSDTTFQVSVEEVPPVPKITASGPIVFCPGESVVLTAPEGYTYLWSNDASSRAITVTTAGEYSVKIFNNKGCSATSEILTVMVNSTTAANE